MEPRAVTFADPEVNAGENEGPVWHRTQWQFFLYIISEQLTSNLIFWALLCHLRRNSLHQVCPLTTKNKNSVCHAPLYSGEQNQKLCGEFCIVIFNVKPEFGSPNRFLFFSWNRVSLHSSGWPGILYIGQAGLEQAGLELTELPPY